MADSVQRFTPKIGTDHEGEVWCQIQPNDLGDWVRFSDYEAERTRREEAEQKWAETRDKYDAESERAEEAEQERDEAIRQRDHDYKRFSEAKQSILGSDKRSIAAETAMEECAVEFEKRASSERFFAGENFYLAAARFLRDKLAGLRGEDE